MRYAITGSLFLITLAGAATVQDRIAEQDGFGIELEERLTERGTIPLDFGATISASSYLRGVGQYRTIWLELARHAMPQTPGTMEGAAGLKHALQGLGSPLGQRGCCFKMARQWEVAVRSLRDFALNSMILMICLIVSAYVTSGSISASTAAVLLPIAVVGGVACTILFRKLGA